MLHLASEGRLSIEKQDSKHVSRDMILTSFNKDKKRTQIYVAADLYSSTLIIFSNLPFCMPLAIFPITGTLTMAAQAHRRIWARRFP